MINERSPWLLLLLTVVVFFPPAAMTGKSDSTRREGIPLREIESEAQEAVGDELHILLI